LKSDNPDGTSSLARPVATHVIVGGGVRGTWQAACRKIVRFDASRVSVI
jgi:hypothetical protein